MAPKAFGQQATVSFDKTISHFKNSWRDPLWGRINDSVTASLSYQTKQFNVSISNDPIAFDTDYLIIKNPYYKDDIDDYADNYLNYPVSYSVISNNKLISLFRNGRFVCHTLDNLERDYSLEKKLNVKKFRYHWIVDNKLAAIAGRTIYVWNGKWMPLETKFPLTKQPKLYEDSEFIVFSDCHGEFGGTIYFFDKATSDTYSTESTCANSVYKKDSSYIVLARLGHGPGVTQIKSIDNPRKLPKAKKSEAGKTLNEMAQGHANKSQPSQILLDWSRIQIFSTFNYQGRQLHLAHLAEMLFLAEIKGTDIQIVHPLFAKEIYTHEPVTTSYGDYTLINLNFDGIARDKEVSVIIIGKNKITKVDWNERAQ